MRTGHILTIGVGCCKKYGLNKIVNNVLLIDFLTDTEEGSLILKNGFFDINCDIDFVKFLNMNIQNCKMDKENLEFYNRKIEVFKENIEELNDTYNFYFGEKYLRKINEILENENSKNENSKNENSKNENSKNEIPKNEIPKNENPKNEIPKNEIPKNEIPKNEIPKNEIPKNEKCYNMDSTIRRLRNITKAFREVRKDFEQLHEKIREHRNKIEFFSIKI